LFSITQIKSALGCARTLSKASRVGTFDYLPHGYEVWRSIHIRVVAVSKEAQT